MSKKSAGLGLIFIIISVFTAVPQDKSAQNTETVNTAVTSQLPETALLLKIGRAHV